MGKVRPSPARRLPRRDQDPWGDSPPIFLPHWIVGPQAAGFSTLPPMPTGSTWSTGDGMNRLSGGHRHHPCVF